MLLLYEKYEILEVIGRGNNGILYKVKDKEGRILAVKETKKGDSHEEEILKRCFHPALPVIVETFIQEDRFYMVMEYIEGMTLLTYIEKRGKVKEEQAVNIGKKIAEVLIYLHERNPAVIYGDLKPENIMIAQDGRVRLIDFGSAFYADAEKKRWEGTYAYAPKEQREGKWIDERSDIYAFGALLHHMLTGVNPAEPPYLRRKIRDCDKALSEALQDTIEKCLRENPRERFGCMRVVEEELTNYKTRERKYKIFRGVLRGIYWAAILFLILEIYLAFVPGILPIICMGVGIYAYKKLFLEKVWRREKTYLVEKKVWKTDKAGKGLFLILMTIGIGAFVSTTLYAKAVEQKILKVQIYDEKGRKVCLKEGFAYTPTGAVRLEIGEEYFPQGRNIELSICWKDRDLGESREYLLPIKRKTTIENTSEITYNRIIGERRK